MAQSSQVPQQQQEPQQQQQHRGKTHILRGGVVVHTLEDGLLWHAPKRVGPDLGRAE